MIRLPQAIALLLLLCGTAFPDGPPVADFRNIAAEAGLTHAFPNGGETTKRYILETTGSGVGLIDINNDGLLDALLLSGEGASNRLYRNTGNRRFADVTEKAGLKSTGWAQGVCAGDFDNDGFTDLLITFWGRITLYRNRAGKRFDDITETAGLKQERPRYNTGCAFLDYDRDGDLDLFVANYLKFDYQTIPEPGANPYCFYRNMPVNCGPRGLEFDRNILYRNDGGRYTDVSELSRVARPARNYSLGVLTGDFDNDGWVDVFVACDQTPSLLYMNRADGTFSEEALLRGAALDADGKALSGMGAAAADYDGDGWLDIFRTNFSDERETLYRNRGQGEFDDLTLHAGLGHNTRFVGWGCGFFDLDHDSWKDLLLVNGHVFPEVDRLKLDIRYKDRAILYRNLGNARFADISAQAGLGVLERHSARGAAFGDIDNDGTVEILINNQNEPPTLLRQARRPPGNWVVLSLSGTRANRSAIGARVVLTAGGRTQIDDVRSGGSYLSQSDFRLHFGLGSAAVIDQVEIRWPAGNRQTHTRLPVNRVIRLKENAGELRPGQ